MQYIDTMENPTAGPAPTEVPIFERQRPAADQVIKDHVLLALGAGLIPVPLVDAVAITMIEVNMIGDLAGVYDFPIPHKLVRHKILLSLLGSFGPLYAADHLYGALKVVPLIGFAASAAILSLTGGVSVYVVGRAFQKHYESGGTFLSGNNAYLRRFFRETREEGRQVVPEYARAAAIT